MIWSDWSSFVAMGGYGYYVWGAFGMAAAAMACESMSLRARRRAVFEQPADVGPHEHPHDRFAEADA